MNKTPFKTPVRYLIGILLGITAGIFIKDSTAASAVVSRTAQLTLLAGSYFVFPLILFSLPIAVTRLRRIQKTGKVLVSAGIYMIALSAILTLIGTLSIWLPSFGRLPVIASAAPEYSIYSFSDIAKQVLQLNFFRLFSLNSPFLLPLVIPAFIIGWHMHFDKEIAEPAFNLFDSLSRLFYRANHFLIVLMPLFLAVLSAKWVMDIRTTVDFTRFVPLLVFILILSLIITTGIYPLVIRLSGIKKNPYKVLFSMSGAYIGALFSGSTLFNYGNFTIHLKENLKIPRESGALLSPLLVMFSRAGTAMITAIAMLAIQKSYSSLEITFFQAAWTALFSFIISFALPYAPAAGISVSLILITKLYGRGLQDGWLIMVPLLPFLMMLASFLDTVTHSVIVYIANEKNKIEDEEKVPELNI